MPDMLKDGMFEFDLVAEAKLSNKKLQDAAQFQQSGKRTLTVVDNATFYLSNEYLNFNQQNQAWVKTNYFVFFILWCVCWGGA